MFYKNRQDAALKLIPLLQKYKNDPCIVLAVPRGGVPIGHKIAQEFNFPLEIVLTKKIGHPLNSEVAIGAVSLDDYFVEDYPNVPQLYIDKEIVKIKESLKLRYKHFMGNHEPIEIKNKIALIVDDGIATGNTLLMAIKIIKNQNPKKIVVVVPVSPIETAIQFNKLVDDFICPLTVENFKGVGFYYLDFSEVSDIEVIKLLNDSNILKN